MERLKSYLFQLIKNELEKVESENRAPVVATHRAIIDQLVSDANEAITQLKEKGLLTESISLNRMPLYTLTSTK